MDKKRKLSKFLNDYNEKVKGLNYGQHFNGEYYAKMKERIDTLIY
jgi:hypothetical protein